MQPPCSPCQRRNHPVSARQRRNNPVAQATPGQRPGKPGPQNKVGLEGAELRLSDVLSELVHAAIEMQEGGESARCTFQMSGHICFISRTGRTSARKSSDVASAF